MYVGGLYPACGVAKCEIDGRASQRDDTPAARETQGFDEGNCFGKRICFRMMYRQISATQLGTRTGNGESKIHRSPNL